MPPASAPAHAAIPATPRSQSLAAQAQAALEQQILTGALAPGAPLREIALSDSLGISRGPIREAFRTLEARGLVVFERNCGVYVRTLDLHQAAQIYQVRVPLEALIGELVATHCGAAQRAELQALLARMEAAVAAADIATYSGLNLAFHDTLARASGNEALHDTYRRLVAQLKLFRDHTFRHVPETIALSLQEHRRIFDTLISGDAAATSRLLREHAEASQARLGRSLEGNIT